MAKKADPRWNDTRVIESSGNVFVDLGCDPAEAARIAVIVAEANRVFGESRRAKHWLTTVNPFLGGPPMRLLDSDAGAQTVRDELARIHWGDYA